MRFTHWLALAGLSVLLPAPRAQTVALDNVLPKPGMMQTIASRAKDLSFPTEPSSFGLFGGPQMALYRPEGNGPFPALVLLHQCGGLKNNASMYDWAKQAVAKGYVVLLVDAYQQRGVDSTCYGPKNGVFFHRGVKDAYQASAHLAKLPYVDARRIALAGYSWGAMVGLMASSRAWAAALSDGARPAAVVSFYPLCLRASPPGNPDAAYDIAPTDIDRPLLVLMGGADTEAPPDLCLPRLEAAKAQGAPVQWHLYPQATHCFDCSHLNNFTKVDARGAKVIYRYDQATTADAAGRMFEFLARVMDDRR